MFGDRLLFGLFAQDDMMFPDWANKKYVTLDRWNNSHTVEQDSYFIGLQHGSTEYLDPEDCSEIIINGVSISANLGAGSSRRHVYNPTPCFCCSKGTVLKNNNTSKQIDFCLVPLMKGE